MGHFKQSLEMPKKSFPYQSGATVINEIIGWKIPKFHQASECYGLSRNLVGIFS